MLKLEFTMLLMREAMTAPGPPPGAESAEAETEPVVLKNAGLLEPGGVLADQLRPSDQLVLLFAITSAPVQLFATNGLLVRTS